MSAAPKHTNRLAREKSPYLLQHAHNPVDWFAWGDEAFTRARSENKPILLSIGYSTCHWCHVMERESFEDEKIGAYLRDHFISIKVDREERPDVDKIYMTFVQSTTGSGGWPLNVFLTPDLKPFFGGTYFPPDARHGRPSFLQLLQQIAGLWRERRLEIGASADELHARLELMVARDAKENSPLTPEILRRAVAMFKEAYDPANGGFGGAPKFPQPAIPSMFLRGAKRFGDAAATQMVLHTCERMAAGGIHDQLGGGFARYAVDAEWLVPHFEKMLYDNAQLVHLYLDAFLASGDSAHAATARDILDYVLRDMTHPGGGWYSAEDADSEGQEGKFYCWTHDELSKLLTPGEFIVTAGHFGITKPGNFIDHSHPNPLPGLNVLSIIKPIAESGTTTSEKPTRVQPLSPLPQGAATAAMVGEGEGRTDSEERVPSQLGQTPTSPFPRPFGGEDQGEGAASDEQLLTSAKAKMLAVRAKRIRPHLDDKILASWNGLMLGAFARASAILGDEKYRTAAEKNLRFLRTNLWQSPNGDTNAPKPVSGSKDPQSKENVQLLSPLPKGEGQGEGKRDDIKKSTGTLYHRWRDNERDHVQLLEAYAFLLDGVIHLYEATLDPQHLDFACDLADAMIAKFYDPANGGFWQSPAGTNDLILRVKDDYDGAEPSGNSVATLALLKLAAITGREAYRQPAEATLQLAAHRLQNQPAALAYMLSALDFWLDEPRRVVIAGDTKSPKFHTLLHAGHSVYQPNKTILSTTGPVEPFAKTLTAKNEAEVFVCLGTACQLPTSDPEKVRELML